MIRSFKAIADGALGSHGALLKKAYNDYNGNGIAVTSKKELLEILCTHPQSKYSLIRDQLLPSNLKDTLSFNAL